MVIAGDPPEVGYGWSECGACGADLFRGKNPDGSQHKCKDIYTEKGRNYE